jgi:tetratricopeptide (TPR) repeat protein
MARDQDDAALLTEYQERYDADATAADAAKDVAAAKKAIEKGELQQALYALAGALSVEPGRKAWLTLLKKWGDAAGDQRDRLLGQSPWFALAAVRAFFVHRSGDTSGALERLANLTRGRPAARYLEAWALDWLSDKALRKLYRDPVIRVFTAMFDNRYPEFDQLTDQQKEDVARAAEALERVERAFGTDEKLLAFKLMVLGKAGRIEEATRSARAEYERNPCWHTAVAVANALRRTGDRDGAVEYFRTAAGLDPRDVTALLDAGDTDLEDGKHERALESYEQALEREEDQPWAKPSAEYCRYLITGQNGPLTRLLRLAAVPPDQCGVGDALASLFGEYSEKDCRERATYLVNKLRGEPGA